MFLSRLYLSMASLLAAIMLLGDLCAAPSLPSQAFLDQHCVKCHAGEKAKGDFRIAELTLDFSVKKNRSLWEKVHQQITSGEMPRRPDRDQMKKPPASSPIGLLNKALMFVARKAVWCFEG